MQHTLDQFDDYDEVDSTNEDRAPTTLRACNRCHSYDVRWRQQGGKWVMFSLQAGVPHACPVNADDFDEVPE